jgi:hypothetical protein
MCKEAQPNSELVVGVVVLVFVKGSYSSLRIVLLKSRYAWMGNNRITKKR